MNAATWAEAWTLWLDASAPVRKPPADQLERKGFEAGHADATAGRTCVPYGDPRYVAGYQNGRKAWLTERNRKAQS